MSLLVAGLGLGQPGALQPASLVTGSPELQLTNPPRDAAAPRQRRERPHYSCRCFPAYVKARATWDRQRGGQAVPAEAAAAEAVDAMFKSAAPPFADGIEGSGVCVHLLDPEGRDIADPIGGDLELYAACAAQIEAAVEARLDEWA